MSDGLRDLDDLIRDLKERSNATGLAGFRYRVVDRYRVWRRRVIDLPGVVQCAWQRVVRGWDDSAVWNLDNHLAGTLGAQLVMMSEIAHGYPSEDYPYDRWTADLRRHGEALLTYRQRNDEVFGPVRDAVYGSAREALVWVADNLGALWD